MSEQTLPVRLTQLQTIVTIFHNSTNFGNWRPQGYALLNTSVQRMFNGCINAMRARGQTPSVEKAEAWVAKKVIAAVDGALVNFAYVMDPVKYTNDKNYARDKAGIERNQHIYFAARLIDGKLRELFPELYTDKAKPT